jgi:hypothetical protein
MEVAVASDTEANRWSWDACEGSGWDFWRSRDGWTSVDADWQARGRKREYTSIIRVHSKLI